MKYTIWGESGLQVSVYSSRNLPTIGPPRGAPDEPKYSASDVGSD
jgi:hypothetical protein